jgi:hypothetical protein
MLVLQKKDIISLYSWLDDQIPKPNQRRSGRRSILSNSELITILIWNTLTIKQKTLKDIYLWIKLDYQEEFPKLPSYEGFVKQAHRILPQMILILNLLLDEKAPLKFVDSTMLEVCKLVRVNTHKVAKSVAKMGKNHQGWHYGFKLHLSINHKRQLASLVFTPADIYDAQVLPKLLNQQTKIAVGDSHYGASVMREYIFKTYGTLIIAPPHYKQNKKVMTPWQHKLLTMRPKIESVFDYLKEHLHLVSSFPRSVMGYLLHYVRILLGYQIMVIS